MCMGRHLLCENCESCRCGQTTSVVNGRDGEISPYHIRKLIRVCPDNCGFYCMSQAELDAHQHWACGGPGKQVRGGGEEGEEEERTETCTISDGVAFVTSTTADVCIPRMPCVATVMLPSGYPVKVFVDQHAIRMEGSAPEFVQVVLYNSDVCVYGAMIGRDGKLPYKSASFTCDGMEPVTLSVRLVFCPNESSIARELERRTHEQCARLVPHWRTMVQEHLREAALRLECPVPSLPSPIILPRHLAFFEDVARHTSPQTYTGGLHFWLNDVVCDNAKESINGFFFYLADYSGQNMTYVVCSGCLRLYSFPQFCAHILISPDYILNNAMRVDPSAPPPQPPRYFPPGRLGTPCQHHTHGSNPQQEIQPLSTRKLRDNFPMDGLLELYRGMPVENGHCGEEEEDGGGGGGGEGPSVPPFYGEFNITGGRERLIAVYLKQGKYDSFQFGRKGRMGDLPMDVCCAVCDRVICNARTLDAERTILEIAEHFQLDTSLVRLFCRLEFYTATRHPSLYLHDYDFNRQDTLLQMLERWL